MKKKNYVGHLIHTPRDFTKPNFNLRSRDMVKALINASLENQGGMNKTTPIKPGYPLSSSLASSLKAIPTLNA
ncbi:hypothetical protein ACWLZS_000905 [Vibrio parahaemolyticus]